MNMEHLSVMVPLPKTKVENDESDIIDLDNEKTQEDLVYDWHLKVCTKLKDHYIVESEGALDQLMKWYIELFKEEAMQLEDKKNVKDLTIKHIHFFNLYFLELNCCFVDNYLDNMEDILSMYSTIAIRSLPKKQRDKRPHKKFLLSVCRKIITTLNLYLMNREDRIFHVLMKMKTASLNDESKELLNLLYSKLLTKQPTDKSELAFCRCYILYQKWKTIRKPEDWNKMDEVIYKLYDQSPQMVKDNNTLRRILLPQHNSVFSTLIHISEKHIIICDEYFKYISSLKITEENGILPRDIDINDSILPELNDEDEEFNMAYINFVKSMAEAKNVSKLKDPAVITIEDEDDDCQIVAVSSVTHVSEETELIHEIFDDDGDDIEIIYFKKKKDDQQTAEKQSIDNVPISFLDSIDVSENVDVSSSSSTPLPDHQTPVINQVSTSTTMSPIERDSSKYGTLTQTIETQTEDFSQVVGVNMDDSLSSKKSPENCQYGLVTPPSDIPSEDHNVTISSQRSRSPSKIVSLPCPSPDITSTSTDIQDLHKNLSSHEEDFAKHRVVYENLNNTLESEEYLNNGGYCTEEYLTYAECNVGNGDLVNNENVSQSNLEDGEEGVETHIEDPVLIHNEEELSFIIEEALPIGSNVNICMENEFDESFTSNDISSPITNLESVQPEISEQVEGSDEIVPLKEVCVTTEKVDMASYEVKNDKTPTSPKKIMYTSSEKVRKHTVDEFSKFEETIQLRWNKLKETHNLDEIFSGPILKMNAVSSRVSPDTNFDLFNSKPSVTPQVHLSQTPSSSSANSSGEVTSPAYEGIDDFRSYYEENKNNMLGVSSPPKITLDKVSSDQLLVGNSRIENNSNKTAAQLFAKKPQILQNEKVNLHNTVDTCDPVISDNKNERISKVRHQSTGKRIRIANNVIDTSNSIPLPLSESPPVLQSILKKTSSYNTENVRQNGERNTRPRIPRRLMNLKSLAEYNVKPNDPCLQSAPCVVIERLSESEISQWLRVSEISRKIRLEKQQAQFASSQLIFRVDYDKQTSHINENDVVRYNTPDGRQWRSDYNLQTKFCRLEEGMVASVRNSKFNDDDYVSIPVPCKNSCCNSLTNDLSNLNVSKMRPEIALNLSCCNLCSSINSYHSHSPKPNPFLLDAHKTKEKGHPKEHIDFNKTCDNSSDLFDFFKSENIQCTNEEMKASLISNFVDNFHRQPAIVPEVEDFEKAAQEEETGKTSIIPLDLYNLNLRKFSPSPIINCFSPQSDSPSHTFVSDTCPIDNTQLLPEIDNCSSKNHLYKDDSIADFDKFTDNLNMEVNNKTSNNENLPHFTELSHTEQCDSAKGEDTCKFTELESKTVVDQLTEPEPEPSISKEHIVEPSDAKIDVSLGTEAETRLPLKKRKLSVANKRDDTIDEEDMLGPDLVEEIIKRARAENMDKEDISYPAKPMISIAEIQEKLAEPHPRVFKTPAERKEMPPATQNYSGGLEGPRIVTEQYNTHTYNNPTINYHMNNIPYPFFPCASLPYFPPILLPLNSSTTFDVNLVNQQQSTQQQSTATEDAPGRPTRERRSRGRKKNN